MTATKQPHLLGRRLTAVHYDLLAWDAEPSVDSTVDEVAMAVLLTFDTSRLLLRWDLRPPVEQLVVLSNEPDEPKPLTRRADVSRRWTAFLGAKLIGASWADQETTDGLQPWAITLAFEGAGELVIALGELLDGIPTYLPDSLIVTASRDVALSYRPPASLTPAWTSPAAPNCKR